MFISNVSKWSSILPLASTKDSGQPYWHVQKSNRYMNTE